MRRAASRLRRFLPWSVAANICLDRRAHHHLGSLRRWRNDTKQEFADRKTTLPLLHRHRSLKDWVVDVRGVPTSPCPLICRHTRHFPGDTGDAATDRRAR